MLAIIPARAGSKGVLGKNLRKLGNKPLIVHTIEAAIDSKKINRIIVSTDSEAIAKIAIERGAEVPFLRPKELSKDDSMLFDTFNYVLNRLNLESENKLLITSFVALQPTSPFRTSEDIDNAIELFNKNNVDSVISFTKESHPVEWNRIINSDGTFSSFLTDKIYNRQMYKTVYRFNGAVYVYNANLIKQNLMYTKNSLAYVMPHERSLDIDTEDDFLYAEFLINKQMNEI